MVPVHVRVEDEIFVLQEQLQVVETVHRYADVQEALDMTHKHGLELTPLGCCCEKRREEGNIHRGSQDGAQENGQSFPACPGFQKLGRVAGKACCSMVFEWPSCVLYEPLREFDMPVLTLE